MQVSVMTYTTINATVILMITATLRVYVLRMIQWCARALQLQLFLTLFSLPILIAWGLPVSPMSPLGNLIFNPFLVLFLALCSCVFFAQLLHIPYSPCAYALNYVSDLWLNCMHYGDTRWLIGITRLPTPVLFAVGIAPLGIIAWSKTRSLYRSLTCFVVLCLGLYGYTNYTQISSCPVHTIPCGNGELTLITTPTTTLLIDPGYLGSSATAASWIRYVLVPSITSTTGRTTIDHIILLQPMGFAFEAAKELCSLLRVRTLHIPYWQGAMPQSHLHRFGELRRTIQATQTSLQRYGSYPKVISKDQTHTAHVTPVDQQIIVGPVTAQALKLCIQIDNDELTIYSAKYTKHAKKSLYATTKDTK